MPRCARRSSPTPAAWCRCPSRRRAGTTTDIEVKEVLVRPWDGKGKSRRYVVCYNPERAAWEAAQRSAIIEALQEQLSRGDKSLVGHSGFRECLKVVGDDHFALDEAKVAEEAKLDGFYVLRTNSKLPTLEVAMRYRELWKVEQIFRTTKAVLETRPIYHASDAAIRGHLFTSFLALVLRKELQDRLQAAELDGRTSSPTSTASSRPPLSSMDVASCCAIRRQAVPERCSRPLVSPCRRCSDAWTRKIPPHPPARPARNPASAASHPASVVPRRPRKNESTNQINKLQKSGVEVELDHHLDPRQMLGQSAAALPPLPAARLAHLRGRLLRFGIAFGDRLFKVLEPERQLVG